MTVILSRNQLSYAADLITRGHPVALPTETVYGLAASYDDLTSVARVFQLKARPHFDPLIVHIDGMDQLKDIVDPPNPVERSLMDQFWPGPLTLLLNKKSSVSDLVTSGSPWVAVRMPDHEVFRSMISKLGRPLVAPSANRFGRISPVSAIDVVSELGPYGLEAVIDGGRCRIGVESTIVRVRRVDERPGLQYLIEILRPGGLSREDLLRGAGRVHPHVQVEGPKNQAMVLVEAPGQLESHYAPSVSCELLSTGATTSQVEVNAWADRAPKLVLIACHHGDVGDVLWNLPWAKRLELSSAGNDREAATSLFASLRMADHECRSRSLAGIVICPSKTNQGLFLAINDRIRRSTAARSSSIIV